MTMIVNDNHQQMELPLELGKGEKVLQHTRLVANSARNAWYELFLIRIPHGYLIQKHSGGVGCGKQKEVWFRRHLGEAEGKFKKIVDDKTNPLRRSPRKYAVEQQQVMTDSSRA